MLKRGNVFQPVVGRLRDEAENPARNRAETVERNPVVRKLVADGSLTAVGRRGGIINQDPLAAESVTREKSPPRMGRVGIVMSSSRDGCSVCTHRRRKEKRFAAAAVVNVRDDDGSAQVEAVWFLAHFGFLGPFELTAQPAASNLSLRRNQRGFHERGCRRGEHPGLDAAAVLPYSAP